MNVLIIGFGSIGKRHYEILKTFTNISTIALVTKQEINETIRFQTLEEVSTLESYDYFIISSETNKHYEQLNYLCKHLENKKILVEKPLYDKSHKRIESSNTIFTAYNLRFHPVLEKLQHLLKDEKIYYANIICGQYLPTWRPTQDYRNSYSASKKQGGGVLRDLSHELDYSHWLFGTIVKVDAMNTKISELEIDSDDIFTAIALTDRNIIVNITMDYISKTPIRRLIIHTQNRTIEADFIHNSINISNKNSEKKTIQLEKIESNHTYSKMHQAILNNNHNALCSFTEGEALVKLIDNIEFQELNR